MQPSSSIQDFLRKPPADPREFFAGLVARLGREKARRVFVAAVLGERRLLAAVIDDFVARATNSG